MHILGFLVQYQRYIKLYLYFAYNMDHIIHQSNSRINHHNHMTLSSILIIYCLKNTIKIIMMLSEFVQQFFVTENNPDKLLRYGYAKRDRFNIFDR